MKISESRQHISIGQTYQDNRVNHESTVIYGDDRSGHGGDSTSQSADSSGHSGDSSGHGCDSCGHGVDMIVVVMVVIVEVTVVITAVTVVIVVVMVMIGVIIVPIVLTKVPNIVPFMHDNATYIRDTKQDNKPKQDLVTSCYSWVSRDVINFTGGQLQIKTQSSEGNNFSPYVLTFCLPANMCNFVRFVHSSTA